MIKYPKIRYPTDRQEIFDQGTIYIQEKLDGANFRFTLDDGLLFGSRNTEGSELNEDQFERAISYVEENLESDDTVFEGGYPENYTIFGEAMIPHTISYDWERTPGFIGFDVWTGGDFMHPSDAKELIEHLGLPFVPIIDKVPVEDWNDYEFEYPESQYYDGLAEGVVLKNPQVGVMSKLVRDEYREKKAASDEDGMKKHLDHSRRLSREYMPNARIKKSIYKLRDEGRYENVSMEMVRDAAELTIQDFMEEEGFNFVMSENDPINLKDFRSDVFRRTALTLRQMIDEQIAEMV